MANFKRTILTALLIAVLIIAAYAAAFIANNIKASKEAQAMLPAGEPEVHADNDVKSEDDTESGSEDENAFRLFGFCVLRAQSYGTQNCGKKLHRSVLLQQEGQEGPAAAGRSSVLPPHLRHR